MTDEPQFLAPNFTPTEEHREENGVRAFGKIELYSISLVDVPPHPSWRIVSVDDKPLESQ